MRNSVESGSRRWMIKAVREAAGELFHQFHRLDDRALCWSPAEGEWCLKEIAAHVRDAERMYLRQIEAIAHGQTGRLPYEAVDVLPSEENYREVSLHRFLWEFEAAREETVWLLRTLDEDDWTRSALHPYRGEVTLYDIARELHEHDLDHLFQARRLRDAVERR